MTRVHFIGIGGAGMSGIARVLLARGTAVSGSDAKDSVTMAALRALGADVHVGHDAAHLAGASTVVVSSAIRETNPELAAARATDVRIIHRATALAELLTDHRAVAVAGTHGKTSTTSMLTVAAQHCGVDPSFAIGGDLNEAGSNAHHGSGDLFVVEADESDGSFLAYHPHAAIVTNVEPDHLDHHGTVEAYTQAFQDFVGTVTGFVVLCADDPGSLALSGIAETLTYGTSSEADLVMQDLTVLGGAVSYTPVLRGHALDRVVLQVAGEHMARNSAAALLTALELGLPEAQLIEGLSLFTGVRRRMELKGTAAGIRVYDDYAHHPTEVRAQLTAARGMAGGGRLIAVFQPHMYSRTRTFSAEFGAALALADDVVVMEVYGAREDPIPGVTGALVAAEVSLPATQVIFQPSWSAVAADVVSRAAPGDLVVTLGAGDVTQIGPEVLRLLEGGEP